MSQINRKKNNYKGYMLITLMLVVTMTIAGILIFFFYINRFRTVTDANWYDHYYVMITEDAKSSLWQTAYEGAYLACLENNRYVDLLISSFDFNY